MTNYNIKTIKFSELKDEDKQELSKFIKANRMKFQKDEKTKKYITLIHLINPIIYIFIYFCIINFGYN